MKRNFALFCAIALSASAWAASPGYTFPQTPQDNSVTSEKIVDGAIVNADVNAAAAIVDTKLATIATAGKVSDTALSSNVPLKNAVNSYTTDNKFLSGKLIVRNPTDEYDIKFQSDAQGEAHTLLIPTIGAQGTATLACIDLLTPQIFTAQQIFQTGAAGASPVITRQTGGTPGTDEIQIGHSGTLGVIESKDGNLQIKTAAGGNTYFSIGGSTIWNTTSAADANTAAVNINAAGIRMSNGDIDFGAPAGAVDISLSREIAAYLSVLNVGNTALARFGAVSNFYMGGSVASATSIVPTGNLFHVTGTTTINTITATGILAGTQITMICDTTALTISDGAGNIKLSAAFVIVGADDTLTVIYDGASWFEVARSSN